MTTILAIHPFQASVQVGLILAILAMGIVCAIQLALAATGRKPTRRSIWWSAVVAVMLCVTFLALAVTYAPVMPPRVSTSSGK